MRVKAVNIKWDCNDPHVVLPVEIEIPWGLYDEDEISNYLSNVCGFCHHGFELKLEPDDVKNIEVKKYRKRIDLLKSMHNIVLNFNDERLYMNWIALAIPDCPREYDFEEIADNEEQFDEVVEVFENLLRKAVKNKGTMFYVEDLKADEWKIEEM